MPGRPCRPHEFRPHPRNEEVTGVGEGATDVREEEAGEEERPTSCMDEWIRASDSSDVLSLALSIKISKHQLYLDADRETFFLL